MIVLVLISATACTAVYADSVAILKQGLLGAGSGAVASAMSGGRNDRIWQGALAGAGVTVIGGALLDMLTGQQVGTVTYVNQAQPYVVEARPVMVVQQAPARRVRQNAATYRRVYRQGFRDGYRQGYRDGYDDASYEFYGY